MQSSSLSRSSKFKMGGPLKSLLPSTRTRNSLPSNSNREAIDPDSPGRSRVGHQGRALRLFGKWRRLSRSGIPALNNCQCSYDGGVDTQDIEPLVLEYLSNKFSNSVSISGFIEYYQRGDERFRSQLSVLLDDVVRDTVKLSVTELAMVLDAVEVSINSIEEMSAC